MKISHDFVVSETDDLCPSASAAPGSALGERSLNADLVEEKWPRAVRASLWIVGAFGSWGAFFWLLGLASTE